ncbi:Hypothetical protein POVR1_LOCUS434 [uncultured virus]|nr:Hypothetical protein POVR1_LOCUS434 [uncultured virus]
MDRDNEVIDFQKTTIYVNCTESYAVRIIVDILNGFVNAITLTFRKSGITITEYNQKQCILMNYIIEEEWLQGYTYNLLDVYNRPVESYSFKVAPQELLAAIKGVEGKRAFLIFYIEVQCDGTNSGVDLSMTNISGNEFIKSFGFCDPIIESDNIYELEYLGRPTSARLALGIFSNIIARFKGRRCNIIDFTLKGSGRIFVTGRRGTEVLSANYLDTFASDDASKDMVKADEDPDIHTIKMSVSETSWLVKLTRLNTGGIIQVYLRDKLPLILRTKMASIGYIVYSFRDDPHIK